MKSLRKNNSMWDKDRFIDDRRQYFKSIFVRGSLPGTGKTSACKNNKNSLFVSSYNKLCQEIRKDGCNAITLNRLLGQGIDDHMKMKKYATSAYNCIVFDAILLYSPKQLHLLNHTWNKIQINNFTVQVILIKENHLTLVATILKIKTNITYSLSNKCFPIKSH